MRVDTAADIVALTYPTTAGDTFYRSNGPHDTLGHAVGVYGLWNALRGDQSPLGGTKVSDDARTIAQFLRLGAKNLGEIVNIAVGHDAAISAVALRTAAAIRNGDYFDPQEVENEDLMPDRRAQLRRTVAGMDGAADYITSIPKPFFGV